VTIPDESAIRRSDPRGMLDAFRSTGAQLASAYRSARSSATPLAGDVRSVTVCAMGGSAAAGDLAAAAFADRIRIPMLVLRGYRVPAGYGPDDLVLCVSYSGDTEETVAANASARERGCRTIAVSGGGELARAAERAELPSVAIPADAPVPRAGLGALVGGIVGVLVDAGVLSDADADVDAAVAAVDKAAADLGPDASGNEAVDLAEWIGDRIPLIWGSEGVSGAAAWRWKTAFNENAEIPSFASSLPELDHHEVVGWTAGRGDGFRLVVLREDDEHPSVPLRLEATLREIEDAGLASREVRARGATPLARAMSLALIGDLASTYHALLRGIDPAAMRSLERIKQRLSEARG
jgi:glucose/mannose-6-phosphate isomerase